MYDLSTYPEIIIWGAHPQTIQTDEISRKKHPIGRLLNLLKDSGYIDKLLFFVDSNTAIYDEKRYGYSIYSPDKLKEHPNAVVIITTTRFIEIKDAMNKMGIKNDTLIMPFHFMHCMFSTNSKEIFDEIKSHKKELQSLYETDDEITNKYLKKMIEVSEIGKDDLYPPPSTRELKTKFLTSAMLN